MSFHVRDQHNHYFYSDFIMKKALSALALTAGVFSSAAFANTGQINFQGTVTSGTCSIEIIDPRTGLPLTRIDLGNVPSTYFKNVNDELGMRSFVMRVTPGAGCDTSATSTGNVTFTSGYGSTGPANNLYALEPGSVGELGLAIKDKNNQLIAYGTESINYDLDDTDPTDMLFSAAYRATKIPVTAGTANTSVNFVFTMK
ncbi:fimbrial protein [Pseudomonas promysalinigenes]